MASDLPDSISEKMAKLKEMGKRISDRKDYFKSVNLIIKVSELVSMSLEMGVDLESVIEAVKLQWEEIEGKLNKHVPVEP